jgi:hypothetical protein
MVKLKFYYPLLVGRNFLKYNPKDENVFQNKWSWWFSVYFDNYKLKKF